MKFNCGLTVEEQIAILKKWHPWFAWYPVRIGSGDCRWLETVQRKGTCRRGLYESYWTWEYK